MYEFSKEQREAALDVCTSYIKRGQNVENRASIISIGLLLQELSDEEINKTIEEKFLRSAKICVMISRYIKNKWDETDNQIYEDFFIIKEFYHGQISSFQRNTDDGLILRVWDECMSKMGVEIKKDPFINLKALTGKLPWLITSGLVIGISASILGSLNNERFQRSFRTRGAIDVSVPTTIMKEKLSQYGFILESTNTERCAKLILNRERAAAGIFLPAKDLICIREEYFQDKLYPSSRLKVYSRTVLTHEAVHAIQDCIREDPFNKNNPGAITETLIGRSFNVNQIIDDFDSSPRGDMATVDQYHDDPYFEKEAVALEDRQTLVFEELLPQLCRHRLISN